MKVSADNGQKQEPKSFGFVKMLRSPDIDELIEVSPLAFTLAAVIALRARWRPGVSLKGLQPGECFLGDHARYGMSRQQYRHAKEQLAQWNFAKFRATSKGTIATLAGTRLFDVLNESEQPTNQPPANHVATTKKNSKKVEKGKNGQTDSRCAGFSSQPIPKASAEVLEYAEANGIPRAVALRFIEYNNKNGWPLKSWHAALRGFDDVCVNTGVAGSDVY